jgi:hypothetical protein
MARTTPDSHSSPRESLQLAIATDSTPVTKEAENKSRHVRRFLRYCNPVGYATSQVCEIMMALNLATKPLRRCEFEQWNK